LGTIFRTVKLIVEIINKYERHLWHVILGEDFLTAWVPMLLERVMICVYI